MAQHGNRSERHEAAIRNTFDAKNTEDVIEQTHRHMENERFFENKAHEKADGKSFESEPEK